jgi:two-component system NtrC family response regulator
LSLSIPPLRERRVDILPLIKHFLKSLSPTGSNWIELTEEASDFLMSYPWFGNVRELKNFCELLVVVYSGGVVDETYIKRLLGYQEESQYQPTKSLNARNIELALSQAGGRMSKAANILGIHRTTLWRRLKRHPQTTSTKKVVPFELS